jgi:hypothetical protein
MDNGASWPVLILPFVEQANLYYSWDLSRSYYEQTDAARMTSVPIYFCPSRRQPTEAGSSKSGDTQWLGGNDYGPHVPGALIDYAACLGGTAFT